MNYSRPIAWVVMLVIINAIAPSVSAQSGGHTEGSHRMLSSGDLTWVDVPSLPPGAKTEASRSNKNRQPTLHPFGYASVYKVTHSLSFAESLRVVQEQFACNSTHWVGLPETLVMALLLRIVMDG
jgi:hypothetical protein